MADTPPGDGLVSMSSQFQGLPMQSLIGGPLTAACDAQIMLARATSDFIETVGFTQDVDGEGKPTGASKVRMVDFNFQRPEQVPQADGSVQIQATDYKLSVPFISIVSVPTLQIDMVDVTFDMEVKSSTESQSSSDSKGSFSGTGKVGWGPISVSVTVSGSVSSHQSNTRKSDNSAKYHVEVHAQQSGTPEGLSRVFDILNNAMAPIPTSKPTPVPPPT